LAEIYLTLILLLPLAVDVLKAAGGSNVGKVRCGRQLIEGAVAS
jgi:hypothetical protein